MLYREYKIAHNRSLETLIECNINWLPVNLAEIAKHYKIMVIGYSKSNEKDLEGDGFSTKIGEQLFVYYNDVDYQVTRQRFTIAHEIGHCLLGHVKENTRTFRYNSEIDKCDDAEELQANVFARNLLMPASVIIGLNLHNHKQISEYCFISYKSAKIRANRLNKVNNKNKFNRQPLERQVLENFKDYILYNKV